MQPRSATTAVPGVLEPAPGDVGTVSGNAGAGPEVVVGDGAAGLSGGLHVHARDREARNTLGIELYQVVVRVGWLFKTETIIMPAVLDTVVDMLVVS